MFLGPLEDRLCRVAHLADQMRPEATGVPSRQTHLRANVPFATPPPLLPSATASVTSQMVEYLSACVPDADDTEQSPSPSAVVVSKGER